MLLAGILVYGPSVGTHSAVCALFAFPARTQNPNLELESCSRNPLFPNCCKVCRVGDWPSGALYFAGPVPKCRLSRLFEFNCSCR